ncbi:MAG: alpha/beta hydrolase [Runella slithyformis]|nr:MAG: alpha/beta hydrolase [Runella slithyformis]TAF23032.1 MAG: alpha/beta hydrolase [Runella slithyformis]TAF49205.1 MAG: alpha/beta hydrolase [Runella slithyformis]TAF80790.1 MAG: alpha/beta hydrolase [Runella slithyformis]
MNFLKKSSRPSLFWYITEPGRALTELGLTYPYNSFHKTEKMGDGHPVMILPGFMGSKSSTGMLRSFVEKLGYNVYDWGLGRNLGKVEYLDLLVMRLEDIYAENNQRPVSLIGWSLGGVFARQLAKQKPHLVRQVITLGSPFQNITADNNATWMYSVLYAGQKVKDLDKSLLQNFPLPAPVPTTAIYTKEDGIVPWQSCIEAHEDRTHQNVQVRGSHFGLGMNASVFHIIKDRLQFTERNWLPFKPKGVFENLVVYP